MGKMSLVSRFPQYLVEISVDKICDKMTGPYLITAMLTGAEAVASYIVDMVDWEKV